MSPQRRSKVVATLLKIGRKARPSKSLSDGPGCTCESCVQAWDRHQPKAVAVTRETRRMRPGLG